jgi:zinc D-Ala-D-Ala carboxypeptidase
MSFNRTEALLSMYLPPPPADYAARVPAIAEATSLVSIGPDHLLREAFLTAQAAVAWIEMRDTAASDGVNLILVSAFRSVERQAEIIAGKLAKGMTMEQALEFSAYPGYSEHHSGNAIDIGTCGCPHLEQEFEFTMAFAWLCENAGSFGFSMTYPRGNPFGIAYEPWHWCFRASSRPAA